MVMFTKSNRKTKNRAKKDIVKNEKDATITVDTNKPQKSTPFDDSKSTTKSQKVSIIQLFQFSSMKERILIFIAFLCSVAAGALQPVSIIIYGRYISELTSSILTSSAENNISRLLDKIAPMIRAILYVGVAAMVLAYVSTCLWIITGESQTRRIRMKYLHSLLHQDIGWYDTIDQQSSLSSRLASDTQLIQDGISENFGLLISNSSQFFASFVIAFCIGWKMELIMLSGLPILFAIALFMMAMSSKLISVSQNLYGEVASVAEQALHSICTIYAFNLQNRFSKLYSSKLDKEYRCNVRRCVYFGIGLSLFMICFYGSLGLAMWYGSRLVSREELDGASVFVVFLAMMTGSVAVTKLPRYTGAISSAAGASFHAFSIINSVPTIDDSSSIYDVSTVKSNPNLDVTIEFKNVTFKYPSRPEITVLDDVSLKISPGMTVALVGASGSGKSTITHLLQRFYDPENGEILINNINIKQMRVSWLRQLIGLVAQVPVLFDMTIRQNLILGDETITDSIMIRACEEANCHQFIIDLPNGYNTLLGEAGNTMLSGGQKQRIAIARAILKDPKILLLDEATSALDTHSERLVQQALEKASKGRATLVVAHRLSTVINADLIVVLDKGKIIEQGNHKSLLQSSKLYANLVKNQAFKDKEEKKTQTALTQNNDTLSKEGKNEKIEKRSEVVDFSKSILGNDSNTSISTKSSKGESKTKEKTRKIRNILKQMYKQMTFTEKKLLFIGVIGASLASCILPLYAYIFSVIVSIITSPVPTWPSGSLQGTNLYSFIILILGVASFLGTGMHYISFAVFEEHFTRRMRNLIFTTLLKQEMSFFDENKSSILKLKLDIDARKMSKMITGVLGDSLQLFFTVTCGLILSMVHSWALSLVTLCMVPLIIISTSYEVFIQKGVQDKSKLANAESGQVATEAIREFKTVASLNKQSYFEYRYSQATEQPHQLIMKKACFTSIGSALHRGVLSFTNALAFYVGAILISKGLISFQQMFTSMTVLITTAQSAGQHTTFAAALEKGKSAAIGIYNLLERQSAIDMELEGFEPNFVSGDVEFKQIKFAYPTRPEQMVLNGKLNLKIDSGQTVALVGASGCGKSTVIGLLQRWYDPLQGMVSLDDRNVRKYSVHNLRSHMALVGQEPVLFDLTIAENIKFFNDDSDNNTEDDQQVIHACKASNIHDFIVNLPDGYNTRVGAMGSQLSGGQKQCIAIARALMRQPKVLLLDEATSALDSESERLVQETLDEIIKKGGKTVITIAHRLSTIKNADIICVVHQGCIVEKGTHTELMARQNTYYSMVAQQTIDTTTE